MKQNPFSFYDFLGYLIPGAVLIYTLFYVFNIDLFKILQLGAGHSSVASQFLSYIPGVIAAYLLGHVLAIGSSAVVESFCNFTNGYPSEYLFAVSANEYLHKDLATYEEFKRICLWLLVLPVSFLDMILNKFLKIKSFGQAKELPRGLRLVVFDKCCFLLKNKISIDVSKLNIERGIDGDYLRLLYHYVYENSGRHANKLQNYVALYGLTRNVSFVFVLSFWFSVYAFFSEYDGVGVLQIYSFSALSYIFYLGFVKFNRRFSLETVMAASILVEVDPPKRFLFSRKVGSYCCSKF
ncbi:hypothetical protein [Bacterioplanoides sp. SCSIO 12839]|uniref:hypothetical protein n=1 Tax=Bacterioplanoides sp. SCSIO 12839 TaxID=2829569 RepID=UPI002104CE14|nr:hypothetical protein [Bacterioplanoides sp. SCSIO 12839]UTW47006.1 hypothetical protein KFF03_10420 [Bacterioplanoides sp. SCSIO 12839]